MIFAPLIVQVYHHRHAELTKCNYLYMYLLYSDKVCKSGTEWYIVRDCVSTFLLHGKVWMVRATY